MTTNAVSAQGIRLGVDINNNGTYKWFNEVKAVPEIGENPDKIEVTHLTSPIKEYIADIPDYSSDLSFTMNAQPFIHNPSAVSDSNLNLIHALSKTATYKWCIVYPQNKMKVELHGQWSWKMGAGSVSSPMEAVLSIIPKSAPQWAEIQDTYTVSYDKNSASATGEMTDSSSPYDAGSTVTVMASTFTPPEGKVFGAWNTMADGTGLSYDASDTFVIYDNTTLYAQWTDIGSGGDDDQNGGGE